MEPSIRGQNVIDAKKYLVDKFGRDAVDKTLERMLPAGRDIISGNITAIAWVEETAFIDFLSAAEKIFGSQSSNIAGDLGYYSALRSIPKFYSIFIKLGDMDFVFKRGQNFWKQVHNHGRIEISAVKDDCAVAYIYENKAPSKIICRYAIGYIKAILEMCGAKDVIISETQCVADGADCCRFSGNWKI